MKGLERIRAYTAQRGKGRKEGGVLAQMTEMLTVNWVFLSWADGSINHTAISILSKAYSFVYFDKHGLCKHNFEEKRSSESGVWYMKKNQKSTLGRSGKC